ncbi:hypothetical protein PGTUg99_035914 [Puccinia graminis f. sp. tritici]|uniref:Uncharacterized protein n=1 Tax=Puccinia graminis f. sp. tritici TaxID=56615 RepID=A0A5B0Q9T7_PUCGR|nr:hypothetical protein PGTUg99_035914 [Puccinia graminis f. sp. tritici]
MHANVVAHLDYALFLSNPARVHPARILLRFYSYNEKACGLRSDESNTIGILMRSSPQRPSLTREQLLLSFPHGGRSGPTGAAGRYMATCIPPASFFGLAVHTPDLQNRQVRLHTALSPTLHTPSCKLYPFKVRLHATLDLVTPSLHPPSSSPLYASLTDLSPHSVRSSDESL